MADPGFSPGGGANSQKCYYFSIFCRKLHENERIWTPRGGARPWRPPLDPPMSQFLNLGQWQTVRTGSSPTSVCKIKRVSLLDHEHEWIQHPGQISPEVPNGVVNGHTHFNLIFTIFLKVNIRIFRLGALKPHSYIK